MTYVGNDIITFINHPLVAVFNCKTWIDFCFKWINSLSGIMFYEIIETINIIIVMISKDYIIFYMRKLNF